MRESIVVDVDGSESYEREMRAIEWNQKRRSRAIQIQKAAERALRQSGPFNGLKGIAKLQALKAGV